MDINLKDLSIEELDRLRKDVLDEIEARKGNISKILQKLQDEEEKIFNEARALIDEAIHEENTEKQLSFISESKSLLDKVKGIRIAKDEILAILVMGMQDNNKPKKSRKVSYTRYYYDKRPQYKTRKKRFRPENIMFSVRGEAEKVLDEMRDIAKEYAIVSVSDYYDLADIPSDYADNLYGWIEDDLKKDIKIVLCMDGYYIDLPIPHKL